MKTHNIIMQWRPSVSRKCLTDGRQNVYEVKEWRRLLLDIGLLQTIAFTLVFHDEQEGDDDGDGAEAGEDRHGLSVVDRSVAIGVGLVDLTNPYGNKGKTDILNVEDEGISCAEKVHRNDLGH